jgi:hypothetical protein
MHQPEKLLRGGCGKRSNYLFQGILKQGRHVATGLLLDLLEAGGASDVDFRDTVTNQEKTPLPIR